MTKQEKHRNKLVKLGFRRMEMMAHPEDWPQIKAYAKRLKAKRYKPGKVPEVVAI